MTRHGFLALSFCAALAVSGPAWANATSTPASDKALFAQAEALRLGEGQAADAAAAFEIMQTLAAGGYGRAQAKLGYYHLKGVGTDPSSTQAAAWYERAIASGRDSARTSYAKLLMTEGQTEEALAQLDAGVAAGIAKARSLRAVYHYEARFGAASDPAQAKAELVALAQDQDIPAMLTLLRGAQNGDSFAIPVAALEASLVSLAQADPGKAAGKAAEGLLKLWQERDDAETRALREELLAHPSLRAKVWAEQSLRLAYGVAPARQFRVEASAIVAQVPHEQRARAFYLVSRLDKNAFVYVLQERLKAQGYYRGRANGYLTERTITALTRFCLDTGIQKNCRLGPLRAKVIRVVTAELAKAG